MRSTIDFEGVIVETPIEKLMSQNIGTRCLEGPEGCNIYGTIARTKLPPSQTYHLFFFAVNICTNLVSLCLCWSPYFHHCFYLYRLLFHGLSKLHFTFKIESSHFIIVVGLNFDHHACSITVYKMVLNIWFLWISTSLNDVFNPLPSRNIGNASSIFFVCHYSFQ